MDFQDTPALKKQWVLHAQWTDCPADVINVVQNLWRYHELGNDNYMLTYSIAGLKDLEDDAREYPDDKDYDLIRDMRPLYQYLIEKNISDDEQVIIHWWW